MRNVINMMFLALAVLVPFVASADVKITGLPLGSAATSGTSSVMPYVDTATNVTKKLLLSDFVNIPALALPQFCTAKPITGYVSGAGVVSATDTILQALNKINGNVDAISAAAISVGAIDSQTAVANGLQIITNVLYGQSASSTRPGMVNNTTQVFSGNKELSGTTKLSALTASLPLQLNASKEITSALIGLTTGVTGVLPYANGGTNASTSWTQKSIMFAGASSFSQNNSFFNWNDSTTTMQTSFEDILGATSFENPAHTANVVVKAASTLASAWNFIFPTSAGTSGQPLLSGGGGTSPQTYGTLGAGGGGTGQVTIAAAFVSFYESVATTLGDIVYGGASGTPSRLAGNTTTTKKVLTQVGDGANSAAPSWSQVGLTDTVTGVLPYANGGTNASTSWTAKSILFAGSSSFSQNNSLFNWNDSITTFQTSYEDVLGSVSFENPAHTFNVVVSAASTLAAAWNFIFPTSAGTSGQPLLSGGGGSSPQTYGTLGYGAGGTAATTTWTQGSIMFAGASAFAQNNSLFNWNNTTTVFQTSFEDVLGAMSFENPAHTFFTAIKAAPTLAASWNLTLPTTKGTSGQALTTDGNGVTTWTTVTGGTITSWASDLTWSFDNSGVTTGPVIFYRRVGDTMEVRGYVVQASLGSGVWAIDLPGGYAIDTTKVSGYKEPLGMMQELSSTTNFFPTAPQSYLLFSDASDTGKVFRAFRGTTNLLVKSNGNDGNNNSALSFSFEIPISGW